MWSALSSPVAVWPYAHTEQRSCDTGCPSVQGMVLASKDCKTGDQLITPDAQGVRLGSSAWFGMNC